MRTRTVVEGLWFGEGPRWHEGALWLSDMHGDRVVRVALGAGAGASVETVLELPGEEPSGLGWLPDGRLLVVAMESRRLLRVEHDGAVVTHADLGVVARATVNDMIVAADGTAYVGDMGFRLHEPGAPFGPGQTLRVDPDGTVTCAADDLLAPNGHALSGDGRTLYVAESGGSRVTAFAVDAAGSLSDRRTFAELPKADPSLPAAPPDGICLDADGAVWAADPIGRRVLRLLPDGSVGDLVPFADTGLAPVACVLGGSDRRTLLICAAPSWQRAEAREAPRGVVLAMEVGVPGAGRP